MRTCSVEIMPTFIRKTSVALWRAAPIGIGTAITARLPTTFRPVPLRNLPCISLSAEMVLREPSLGESVSNLSFSPRLPEQILRFLFTQSVARTPGFASVVVLAKNSAHCRKHRAQLRLRDCFAHQTQEVTPLRPVHDESYRIRAVRELFEFAENRRERIVLDFDISRGTFTNRLLQLRNYGQHVVG